MTDPLHTLHQARRDLEFALTLIPESSPGSHQVSSALTSVGQFIADLTSAGERLLPGEESGVCADDDSTGYLRGIQDEHGDITFTLSTQPRSLTGPHVRMTVSPVRRPAVFRAARLLIWTLQAPPPWRSAAPPRAHTGVDGTETLSAETRSANSADTDTPPWL